MRACVVSAADSSVATDLDTIGSFELHCGNYTVPCTCVRGGGGESLAVLYMWALGYT